LLLVLFGVSLRGLHEAGKAADRKQPPSPITDCSNQRKDSGRVKPAPVVLTRRTEGTIKCAIAGFSTMSVRPSAIAPLRQVSSPIPDKPFPPAFLKHADEQTVLGLTAIVDAIHQYRLSDWCFTDWAVVAAPRFFGRVALATALQRFALEGAWGISPHLIPHRSMHALSGTISQALRIHGPNFGVGGGCESASEMMLCVATLLADSQLPGAWVVLTGWDPEPVLQRPTGSVRVESNSLPSACNALALALVPSNRAPHGPALVISHSDPQGQTNGWHDAGPLPLLRLENLQAALKNISPTRAWRLHSGWRLELEGL
jgi:hypothetical protein